MLASTDQSCDLITDRLVLRAPKTADVTRISLYSSDWRVASKTTTIPHPNPMGLAQCFVAKAMARDTDETLWIIDATKSYGTDLVGLIALRDDGSIGYWLGSFFWGLGLATEALGAVVAHACAGGPRALTSKVFQDNPASRRVLEKQKFELSGETELFSVARNQAVMAWTFERPAGA